MSKLVRRDRWWAFLLMLAFVPSGCRFLPGSDQGIVDAVAVRNNTDVTLHLSLVLADGTLYDMHKQVASGQTVRVINGDPGGGMTANGCTVGDMIAYDPTDHEIARHPPPLCVRARDLWTIGPPQTPSPSG